MAVGDPRFFARLGPYALAEVAGACGAEVPAAAMPPDGSAETLLDGVAPLQLAGPSEVSFLDNRRYAAALAATRAGAVIVHPDMAARVPAGTRALVTADPYVGWARVAGLFHPPPPAVPGVHATALVDASATVDASAEIGPFAVIGARAAIGPRCRIGAHAAIGEGVTIGADCRIGAHVSISHALLGARITLYPGVRVGQDGFDFATTKAGFVSVPQLGRVLIEDDVEVGANTTIDRGSAHDTVIGAGCRLDNLVQIGHNVRLGRCCVVVAQVGISGSTVLEDFVMIGGQAGLAGHIRVGRGARVGAQAGVMSDVAAAAEVVGSPALPSREFFRQVATLRRFVARQQTSPPDDDVGRTGSTGSSAT